MQVVILCSEEQKKELTNNVELTNEAVVWITELKQFLEYKSAGVYIDLLFNEKGERSQFLTQLLPAAIVVNSVVETLPNINRQFIRINGWSTFLSAERVEATSLDGGNKLAVEQAFTMLNKTIEWLPDVVGFIRPRIICSIINEAFFALADGVSTEEEIDTAMKLGTAYPFGPFEWAGKIGLQNVVALLTQLSATQPRYTPCTLLVQQTNVGL